MRILQLLAIAVALPCPSVKGVAADAPGSSSPLKLGAPFSDGAILQRGMPVPVWGWARPGTAVTVEFAGQMGAAEAGEGGKWMLELEPLEASAEPAELKVSSSTGDARILKDVLVGEVWLASGQSNMQWIASKCDVGRVLQKGIDERVAAGEEGRPVIREARVTDFFAHLHPIEHAHVEWGDDAGDMSAIAYAFAYQLHRELGVPIGILNGSFSQTSIQAWTPRQGFRDGESDYTRAIHQRILETDPSTPEHQAAWGAFYEEVERTIEANAERVENGEPARPVPTRPPGNMSSNRDASWLFNARINPMIPFAIRGAIWNQGYANMGEGLRYYDNLHSLVRGWRERWGRPELPVYFHQFYCPGQKGEWDNRPSIGSTAEMRLGTWFARDIPHVGMASQIDITGSIHYGNKTLPGQRLALHALKNQYGKGVVADGPMFKSYSVQGDKLVVEFEHAEGGLVVAETGTESKGGIAKPTVVPGGQDQVKLFYLADENRVWHPASVEIDGAKAIVSAAGVPSPRGVSYGTGGIGGQPNLYNRDLLPTTPFIYYDHQLVTSETWPEETLNVAGEVIDPSSVGKLDEWRKMPLLSTQFREGAVLQAGVPITFWGSVLHDHGYQAEGDAVVHFSFAGIEKTIPVEEGSPHIVEIGPGESRYPGSAKEWRVTVPAMEASAEPKTLRVRFEIDGELAHERVCEDIVIGDVWFVAAPPTEFEIGDTDESPGIVRMMTRKAKRFSHPSPSRYTVCVSRTPLNRFASVWEEANGLAAAIGHRLGAATGKPVGVVFMQSATSGKPAVDTTLLKSWIPATDLDRAPSLKGDFEDLGAVRPGNPFYDANARRYVAGWKAYWGDYIPKMIREKRVPDGSPWGSYPTLSASVSSKASEVYNVLVHSFTPGAFKGIVFLSGECMFAAGGAENFGAEMSALANSWKARFGGGDPRFVYTFPSDALVPNVTRPTGIEGRSTAVEIDRWSEVRGVIDAVAESGGSPRGVELRGGRE